MVFDPHSVSLYGLQHSVYMRFSVLTAQYFVSGLADLGVIARPAE